MRTRGHNQMIRYRIALAASVLLATVHCTTSQAPPGPELDQPLQRASSLTVPPGVTGNGPHAMVVCQAKNGNDCFPAVSPPPEITSIDTLNTELTPPPAWFATATL